MLKELQAIDSRRTEMRKSIEALPERLRPAKQDLAKLEAMLQQERTQLADTEKWRAEQEEIARRDDEAVRQAKAKLQQSRNSKDFAAASREVENKRRTISEREEELVKVISAIEAARIQLAQREKDVEALRQHVTTEEAAVATRTTELQSELEQQESGRDAIASQLPRDLLRRYEQIQRRRVIALVPVVDGICKGCFMSLPPQLNNIIARCTTLESCPSCQRLLYRAEMMAEPEGDGQTAPS
ncbi:MAG TPA: C4-type zinc ribbon domain-containing protein [Kofleriaceae bacterium]|nr:C4-type zinc ribbon domain-containing protein [Kofleriaceae bacterium]